MEVGKGIKREKEVRTFFFLFCFVFVCLFFVCFVLFFTFENDGNLFWVYQNGNFVPGKKFHAGKNRKKWLCPLRKICLLRPCWYIVCNTTNYWKNLELECTIKERWFGDFRRVTWNFVRCRQTWRHIGEIITTEGTHIEQHIVKLCSDITLAYLRQQCCVRSPGFVVTSNLSRVIYIPAKILFNLEWTRNGLLFLFSLWVVYRQTRCDHFGHCIVFECYC